MQYTCAKPEWEDNEPCPIDTGELEDCAECLFCAKRLETGLPDTGEPA